MEISRFDRIEFEVIQAAFHGGYYPEGEHAARALLLMEEGVFESNSISNWWKSGWKFSAEGFKYGKRFMEEVQKKHGHVWMTHRDTMPGIPFEDDDFYGNSVDTFAYSSGTHNGMICKKCGYSFCHHCISEFDVKECSCRD